MKRALPLFVPSLTGWCARGQPRLVVPRRLRRPGRASSRRATTGHRGDKVQAPSQVHMGMASWYGRRWQGRPTASGARYDWHQPTAAHRTAPLGTQAVVMHVANGHTVRVQITDRGLHTRGRILDLSYEAARRLDMVRTGTARVQVEILAASPPFASLPGGPETHGAPSSWRRWGAACSTRPLHGVQPVPPSGRCGVRHACRG